jgi:hypothetical protein
MRWIALRMFEERRNRLKTMGRRSARGRGWTLTAAQARKKLR